MKNVKLFLVILICFISSYSFSQKEIKEYFLQDFVPNKNTTCWDVTKGTAAFGNNICFNANSTAKHATGGFGGIRFKKQTLTLIDLNGKSTDSQKPLIYTILSVSKSKVSLIDQNNQRVELTFKN